MMRDSPPCTRVATRVSPERGSEQSHREAISSGRGSARDKKTPPPRLRRKTPEEVRQGFAVPRPGDMNLSGRTIPEREEVRRGRVRRKGRLGAGWRPGIHGRSRRIP